MPNCLCSDNRTAFFYIIFYCVLTDTPERTELTVNSRTYNLTLNEGDREDFTCRTHGRPSPSMQLVNVTSGQAILSTAGGDVTVEDKVTWLNHSLTAVCQHTGHYNCDVSNSVGNGPRGQVSLFVNCKCVCVGGGGGGTRYSGLNEVSN